MRRLYVIWLMLLIMLALVACGGDQDEQPPATPRPSPGPSATPLPPTSTPAPTATPVFMPEKDDDPRTAGQLRIIHASPDLPAVDLYLEGASIGRSFTQGTYHNPALSFVAGTYKLWVYPAKADRAPTPALLEYPVELAPGTSTLLLLFGTPEAVQVTSYQEDLSPLPTGAARVTAIHAVPRGAVFDLRADDQTLAEQVDFGMTGGPAELEASVYAYTFAFNSGAAPLDTLDLSLGEGYAYTLVLLGNAAENTYRVVYFRSRVNSQSRVRIIQASPDAPLLDAYLDDEPLATGLDYRSATEWSTRLSYAYTLRLRPAGDETAPPLFEKRITLDPNRAVSLVILGSAERLRVLAVEEDLSPTPENGGRMIFVNAAIGARQAVIETTGGELPGVPAVSFGTASQAVLQSAGPQIFYFWDGTGANRQQIDYLPEHGFSAGQAYLVVITGYPNTEPLVLASPTGIASATYIGDQGVFSASTQVPSAEQFELRVLHAVPGYGPVDVVLDGTAYYENIEPQTLSFYRNYLSAPERIAIRNHISGTTVLEQPFAFAYAPRLTLFVYKDRLDSVQYELSPDSMFPIPQGQARLRVFHSAPAQPRLQVLRSDPSIAATPTPDPTIPQQSLPRTEIPVGDAVELGRATEPQDLPVDRYTFIVVDVETDQVIATLPEVLLNSGTYYDLLLLPDPDGQGVEPMLIGHE